MDHLLVLCLLLWTSGVQSEGKNISTESDNIRLVGGASRCAGTLEVKHLGEWRPAMFQWNLKGAAVFCERLDCGSAVFVGQREYPDNHMWLIGSECFHSGSALGICIEHLRSYYSLDLTCSDSVRLVNGSSLCSGRLEVKSGQFNQSNQHWSSVCEADFDQQDAEVVCRELGCGAPSLLQGALYGDLEAPMWPREFQCGGNESALLDCRRSGSATKNCPLGKAVGLTCSEPVRLVGGASRCAGTLEVKLGEWRPVDYTDWTLKRAAIACEHLDCGSVVSVGKREFSDSDVWLTDFDCVQSGSALRECATIQSPFYILDLNCSDSVRLVNGSRLCSGRLEVKSDQFNQSNQPWSSVCEADFDQQDAEVVCRELGCGAPSVLQGALYGDLEAPMWPREFQCGGNESALLDCRRSDSARNRCSPDKTVGLTCSEPDHVRLVGGASRCAGTLEVKYQGEWRPVIGNDKTLKDGAVACEHLDCGSAVSVAETESSYRPVWRFLYDCVKPGSALRECVTSSYFYSFFNLTCSNSVRLVNGGSLCSGRLEVRSNQSDQPNQPWSSVCEADFDQQDAEVVCRELGCGAPSVLQGALYGQVEAPMWPREFQCGGNESALLDCRRSGSATDNCPLGKNVGLTCSEPVRLVGENSRCAGTLEVKHLGEWRPVSGLEFKIAAIACEHLDCGSAVSFKQTESSNKNVWSSASDCVLSGSPLRECAMPGTPSNNVKVTCSDLLVQPNISVSPSMHGVSEAQHQGFQVIKGSNFTISCSIQPQYPGGSFQLFFTSSNTAYNYTQPAVNHSAQFPFPAAEPAHQGSYSCVYRVCVFSYNFSSASGLLSVAVSDPIPGFIKVVVMPVTLLLLLAAVFFYCKACRGQQPARQEDTELVYYNLGVPAPEGAPVEEDGGPTGEEGAQGVGQDLQGAHLTSR